MSTLLIITVVIMASLIFCWRIAWLASRVDRANARAERAWSALDAALAQRAECAADLVRLPGVDPATALLVMDAAAAALEPDLSHGDRERAESDLSHVLDALAPALHLRANGLESERVRASICRRLHNDAVATALGLRRRHTVRILRLSGLHAEPRPFEMAEGSTWTLTVYAAEPRAPVAGEASQPS
jgi:hypothetical protein